MASTAVAPIAGSPDARPAEPDLPTPSTRPVDFVSDVRPIFAAACYSCHGPDKQKSDFRLDTKPGALRGGEIGSSIRPGDSAGSPLIQFVAGLDPDMLMPPEGRRLSADQIGILRAWIDQGAPWPDAADAAAPPKDGAVHWALKPATRPAVPAVSDPDHWVRNPIDAFVLQGLRQRDLFPSPEADRRTLIRRVTFDLTGLPPTPPEVDAFLSDTRPDSYERLVDRLLASPRHGERWASHWIDAVHFAETHGNDQDRIRPNAWPYRDYLIRSFNDDKPYARFVEEQLAGDALYPDDPQATVALGFLGAGPWDESSQMAIQDGTVDKLVARNLDRDDILTTTMSTFASTTVHCARCHNHKFDPIPQAEYYNLQSCFAGVDRADRPYDTDPEVHKLRAALTERKDQIDRTRLTNTASLLEPAIQAEVTRWEQSLPADAQNWVALPPTAFSTASGTVLVAQPDDSLLATAVNPETEVYTVTARTDLTNITGIRVDVLTDGSLPADGPGRAVNGNFHLTEFRVRASPTTRPAQEQPVELHNGTADHDQPGWPSSAAIDDNPQTGWGVDPAEGKPHFAVFETRRPVGFTGGTVLTFVLEQEHGRRHTIGRVRISVTTDRPPLKVAPAPPDIMAILAIAPDRRSDAHRIALAVHFLKLGLDRQLAALPTPSMVYAGATDFTPNGNFLPAKGCRPVFVLKRGDVTQPGDAAIPGGLSCVRGPDAKFDLPDPTDERARRAALAGWLTDPRNVLTWRSIVNRTWHHHIGKGIVDTPNDFGRMGGVPSHPELLDWLTVWFQEQGGSLKSLHRLIVTSAAYRQSATHRADCARVDADNRLLWRMNRARLDAESVRDAVVQITGKIDLTMGGPSVRQFILTPGKHVTPDIDYVAFDPDDPANFRRSIYRFLFRTLPDPFMESMDCPDLSQLTPVRATSVTALQALAMLNDKFIVRQCEHLAERAARAGPELADQIGAVYVAALGRPATPAEIEVLSAYAREHGLANVCRLVLNSNEFMFVD
jgi:mono/diheme cytochrome c family protein